MTESGSSLNLEIDYLKRINGDLVKSLLEAFEELNLFYDVSSLLLNAKDVTSICEIILKKALEIIDSDKCSIMLLDEKKEYFVIEAHKGLSSELSLRTKVSVADTLCNKVLETGKPLFVEDIDNYPDLKLKSKGEYKSKSFIALPLAIIPFEGEKTVIGVISMTDKISGTNFTTGDIKLLTALASQATMAINNNYLFQGLKNLFLETIRSLSSAIDAKDPYTHGHSQRVTEYSLAILDRMNIPNYKKEDLELASLLHDIGKIGIPEVILHKRGKLTNDEVDTLKGHPVMGLNILKNIKQIDNMILWIKYHHEQYDGKGYPCGLKGDKIPLESRILAVADTYDAMTSDRPYRKGLPHKIAMREIEMNSGKQFDPIVVKCFKELNFKSIKKIIKSKNISG